MWNDPSMLIYLIPLFLCWGSFLNVLSYRLIAGISIVKPPSHCVHCKHTIAWFDNIPLISWLILRGRCRYCTKAISYWYPLVELTTAILLSAAWVFIPTIYFFIYAILLSALVVTIRSDFETMLISRAVTLDIIPIAFIGSYMGYLPITLQHSVVASMTGFAVLYAIDALFYMRHKVHGIGTGDMELAATIGAFTGLYGLWISITIGSITASCFAIGYILLHGYQKYVRIPFGPFLAFGTCGYLFAHYCLYFF